MTARITIPGATHMAIINAGDGSAYVNFFSSAERAEEFLAEDGGQRFCDDVQDVSRGFDIDPLHHEWTSFETVVENFILGPNGYRDERILSLAEHFECALGVVRRWADGTARPHPKLRKQVGDFIRLRLRETCG